jgi:hypothetical protein
MQELLNSDEFRRYRKRLIAEVVDCIDLFGNNMDPVEVRAALDMARRIIRLPEKIMTGKKQREIMKIKADEDIKEFQVRFIRSHIMEE